MDMRVRLRTATIKIYGEKQVEGIRLADIYPDGGVIQETKQDNSLDFVCIGDLYPLAELAAISGRPFQWIPFLGGHVPIHNERMQTPVDRLYVALNITGIESAKFAIKQGTIAGLSISSDLRMLNQFAKEKTREAIHQLKETRDLAMIQFHPNIKKGRTQMEELSRSTSFHESTSG